MDRADAAVPDDLRERGQRRHPPSAEAHGGDDAGLLGRAGHLLGLGRVQAERLLAEDVLAGLEQPRDDVDVGVVGQGQGGGLDLWAVDDLLDAGGGPLEAVLGGDGLRQGRVGLDEGVQTDVDALEGGQHLGVAEAEGVALAGESGSDDGNAQVAGRAGHGGGSFRIVVNRRAE